MINEILSWIIQGIIGPLLGFSLEMMLTPKQNRWKRWMRVGLWTAMYMALGLLKFLLQHSTGSAAYNLVFLLFMLVLSMQMYSDPIWKQMLAYLLLYSGVISGELSYFLLPSIYGSGLSMDFTQMDMLLGSFFALICSAVFIALIVIIWRRFQNKRIPRFIWAYILLLLCLSIPSVQLFVIAVETGGNVQWISLVSVLASGVTTLLMIILMFKQAEQESIEQELTQIKFQTALEQQHYQNIESRREEMAKIRHDYNNLLTSILGLLQMGRTAEAETALRELLQRVENTRESPYCGVNSDSNFSAASENGTFTDCTIPAGTTASKEDTI